MARLAFYDIFTFLWITWYTLSGKSLLGLGLLDVAILEVLPLCYNTLRTSEKIPSIHITVPLYLLHRLIAPFCRLYPVLTPFDDAWALAHLSGSGEQSKWMSMVRSQQESLAFTLWACIASGAVGRLIAQFLQPSLAMSVFIHLF